MCAPAGERTLTTSSFTFKSEVVLAAFSGAAGDRASLDTKPSVRNPAGERTLTTSSFTALPRFIALAAQLLASNRIPSPFPQFLLEQILQLEGERGLRAAVLIVDAAEQYRLAEERAALAEERPGGRFYWALYAVVPKKLLTA